ncbi:predicted protein [Nematostella vectensis]|uniref:PSI domain-containing protein n=1 Tax=Nematostella vectensis TaxID=45351 RepID=A7SG99_NEMVE|nr:predicted protein [Nematostella vectensis]|eukprot:XP_001629362.1 predicted protein [Nematostella vectensis]
MGRITVGFILLLACAFASKDSDWTTKDLKLFERYFHSEILKNECKQALSCNKCNSNSNCRWCMGEDGADSICKPTSSCTLEYRIPCQIPELRDYRENYASRMESEDGSLPASNKSQVTVNASSLCSSKTNCSQCGQAEFCVWCDKKKECIPYFNATQATQSCQSVLWYKNQCIYPGTTKPCPLRVSGGCKECVKDDLCYWCESSKNCSVYPHENYVPPDCSMDDLYYKKCSHMKLIVVLIPVLCIVLIPVFAYLILWIVMCCLKSGEKNDPGDSKPSPPTKKKEKPKPIRLHHQPPRSKIEELKKKYALDKEPKYNRFN